MGQCRQGKEWLWDDEGGSVISRLEAGKVIGLFLEMADGDAKIDPWAFFTLRGTSPPDVCCPDSNADAFIDGLLLGADGDTPNESVVRSDSWGRIKASLN